MNLEPKASRLTETIGVSRRDISFNKVICAKMGISPDSKLAILVSDRGFLAINVLGKDSPTGSRPKRYGDRCGTLRLHSAQFARHTTPGRYRITGRDGAFWLTDIRWEEEQQ